MTADDLLAIGETPGRAELCERDPLYFMRYFFKQRMGSKMIVAPHHEVIMRTLQRVLSGEITRLIINISPGYSKTELCTINMMAYGLAINPRAKFLHLSYSHSLALLNSSTARGIVKSPAFQSMWPIELKDDADSKAMWWTKEGGGVYATSAAGQVTGFRAGHMEDGFTGCFPAGTMVETERGPMAIDDIVKSKMDIKVWSCDVSTGNVELKPVIGWWENPRNEIIEVGLSDGTSFRCTPDHKIYTRRGYVRADSLTPSDLLPSYAPHALELGFRDSEPLGNLGPSGRRVEDVGITNCSKPSASSLIVSCNQTIGDGCPSLPEFDLPDDAIPHSVSCDKIGCFGVAGKYLDNGFPVELCARPSLKHRECAVPFGVSDVLGLGSPSEIAKPVVCWDSVKMPAFIERPPRPIESCEDKLMNVPSLNGSATRKAYGEVTSGVELLFEHLAGEPVRNTSGRSDNPVNASSSAEITNLVGGLVSDDRSPLFIRKVGHADNTYCLTVRCNNNFILSSCKALVHNCLIIDDPVKPDDAYSEVLRGGVNNRYNETIASRLAIESVPIIVIMQRIHWDDLSGYLLRGGSGEKWHHLNLPVIIDNSDPYPGDYTHGIPIDHGLPDGWLWPVKHGPEQEVALKSHRRKFWAQYMQKPIKRDEETALWPERLIAKCQSVEVGAPTRTIVAIDPAASNSKTSDAHGIVLARKHDCGKFSLCKDRTRHGSPSEWARAAISLYEDSSADAIVIETNQGGDMCEDTLRNAGFNGRIIRVHASKGKVIRAEPVVALYEQGMVRHEAGLHDLEEEMMDFDPVTGLAGGKSPNRVDAAVWALTELADLSTSQPMLFMPSRYR